MYQFLVLDLIVVGETVGAGRGSQRSKGLLLRFNEVVCGVILH
jgi:hypothetical protein